jgi:hypothetical protein
MTEQHASDAKAGTPAGSQPGAQPGVDSVGSDGRPHVGVQGRIPMPTKDRSGRRSALSRRRTGAPATYALPPGL